jgi:hypothetical protein
MLKQFIVCQVMVMNYLLAGGNLSEKYLQF